MARRSKLKVKKKRASRKSSKPSQTATRKLLEALSLSMEPITVKDHPDGKGAAQEDPSQDDLRKILEKLEQWMEPTTVKVKHRPHAVRQNHVSKPCCGGGGRQEEIKDSSNTSRNQSISDDILSGGEAVNSETLGSPRHKLPLNIRWGEWGAPEEDDSDLRLSEVYPDIWGPFIPLRFAGEEVGILFHCYINRYLLH
ncbi:hypothetical protein LINGRAHAP2_LOCUS13169 [Linum grandiflorum]